MRQGQQVRGNLLLLLASLIWGTAFVAQSVGMEHIGPFTFMAARSIIGALSLVPVILLQNARKKHLGQPLKMSAGSKRSLLRGGILCGLLLTVAANLQQAALLYTTTGKAGFLTALYILLVPIAGIFMGRRVVPAVWLAIAVAAIGLYLLSVKSSLTIDPADLLLIACAFVFTGHILAVDHYSPKVSGVALSCLQFLVAGLLSSLMMFLFESPSVPDLLASALPLLYVGVLSSGVAYTLQIMGQRLTTPAVASLIMSGEAIFALVGGMLILGERMTGREALGSALMFIAIIGAQLAQIPKKEKKLETV